MAPATPPEPAPYSPLAAALLAENPELTAAGRLLVACSGGLDSTVLLHLVASLHRQGSLPMPVLVIHVNHGLQSAADAWQQACQAFCRNLDIPFASERVQVHLAGDESPEEAARSARYEVFARWLEPGDVLLLAQHLDDQVETVLFRLLRGSGVAGLAGMPRMRTCGKGLLLRPLLDLPRAALLAYATQQKLAWSEDTSNQDQRFDRNYLRATIIPALQQRWPGLAATIGRSARLCDEAAELIIEQAAQDLTQAIGACASQLKLAPLRAWRPGRQRNLLRYWLYRLHGSYGFAAPTHRVLHSIVNDVMPAGHDAEPLLRWGKGSAMVELRRFQDTLYALRPLPDLAAPELPARLQWDTAEPLQLPFPLGTLALVPCTGTGLPLARLRQVEVRFRSGGERIKAAGRPTRPLKKLLQELAVPPWMRNRVPLVYADESLVAVGDLCVSEAWLDKSGENNAQLVWRRSYLDCGY